MKLCRLCLCLVLLLLCCAAALAEGPFQTFPDALRFTQKLTTDRVDDHRAIYTTLPTTARQDVNEAIRQVVEDLLAEGKQVFPARGGENIQTRLDVGPYIHRVGSRYLSFFNVGRVAHEGKQIWVDFDTRVYNMEDGSLVTLDQLVTPAGLVYLGQEVQRQLSGLFPGGKMDAAALAACATPQALLQTPFTLTAGHLSLVYRASDFFPDRCLLFHVDVYYPDLMPYMTDAALVELDCSGYQLVAVTYDDGPARGTTDSLLNQLRLFGADCTFFVVGEMVKRNVELVTRENDAGFDVQSHNYTHATEGLTSEKILNWKQQMADLMVSILGKAPTMMRTPGGMDDFYIRAGVGLPLIHWCRISGDAEADPEMRENADRIAYRIAYARDGEIVLCHDINGKAAVAASSYLETFRSRDVLLVTVQDLCAVRGVALKPNEPIYRVGVDWKYPPEE